MKIKNIYIYGVVIIVAALITIYFTKKDDTSIKPANNENSQMGLKDMPKDGMHQKMIDAKRQPPNKNNVSPDYEKMLNAKKSAFEKKSNDTAAIKNYADFLMESHKIDEAIPLYDKILKINPKRTDVYFALTFAYFNKENIAKAEELTKKVLSYDPRNVQAQFNMGAISLKKGDKVKAKSIWTNLIGNNPNSPLAQVAAEQIKKIK